MNHILTDEEAVASMDKRIETVAHAIALINAIYPDTSIEALAHLLLMVNGLDWMNGSDMARARVRAKEMVGSEG